MLDDLAHGADVLRQPVVERGGGQTQRVDRELRAERGHDRLQLGGEHHALAPGHDVQRLDAERVAGEGDLVGGQVVDGEGEHAAEPPQAVRPPGAPGLEHHLGVGPRDEGGAQAFEVRAQLAVVVELAVVGERQPALDQRLVGGRREVDDRQPQVTQDDAGARVGALQDARRVRAAMTDPLHHDAGDELAVGLLVGARDPAHRQFPPTTVERGAAVVRSSYTPR